jgi:hypothetical protein
VPTTQLSISSVSSAAMGKGRLLRSPGTSLSCASARSVKSTSRLCHGYHFKRPVSAVASVVFSHLCQPSLVACPCPLSRWCQALACFSPHEQSSCALISSLVGRPVRACFHRRPNPSLQRTAFGSR